MIEVKAKSFDSTDPEPFFSKSRGKGPRRLSSEWEPYLFDVAFQTFVASKAFPSWKITPKLMLADKSKVASVEGLNQRFLLVKDEKGRTRALAKPGTTKEQLGTSVLTATNVSVEVDFILESSIGEDSFEEFVERLNAAYTKDRMIPPVLGVQCKGCEFRIKPEKLKNGQKSGFNVCWSSEADLEDKELKQPLVFDIWNFRKAQKLIEGGKYLASEVTEADISPSPKEGEPGLSSSERQWLQVQKLVQQDNSPFLDTDGLRGELGKLVYPLHFIDFETTMVALPFNAGRRPYEQIAFQFSHHTMDASGKVAHTTEYLNSNRGAFPNFEFVRALRRALSKDAGSIFRYAAHENTVLCQIYNQLKDSKEPDRLELMDWIRQVTSSDSDPEDSWHGNRSMIDMCDWVKRYFYHPLTGGSNSIKKVLPAALNCSKFLQDRYAAPIYGTPDGIESANYSNWSWVKRDAKGLVLDPYKLLPPIFDGVDQELLDSFITDGSIADGGAAMTAYSRMQFTEMTEAEAELVRKALLKYCELDTVAMVMIFEFWISEVKRAQREVA